MKAAGSHWAPSARIGQGTNRPRTLRKRLPGRSMLCRTDGRAWSTPAYQNTSWISCGVLRTSSTIHNAVLRTSQLALSRMIPSMRPRRLPVTMARAETSSVLTRQTHKARP